MRTPPLVALCAAIPLSACAIMPDLPPDWALPMREILLHSACELQLALIDINRDVKKQHFNARSWKIAITLNPKIDADVQPGAGLTRKEPFGPGVTRFSNWVIGSGNGITNDMRGQRTGSIDFVLDSEQLLTDKELPCDRESIHYHSLTKHLGIRDWLYRAVEASALAGSKIDNPKFSAQVFMKFGGTGTYTYTFPPGTDLLSLGAYYQLDENLNINLTKKPEVAAKFTVVTLPEGQDVGFLRNKPTPPATVTLFSDPQVTLEQIRQQLQNIRTISQ